MLSFCITLHPHTHIRRLHRLALRVGEGWRARWGGVAGWVGEWGGGPGGSWVGPGVAGWGGGGGSGPGGGGPGGVLAGRIGGGGWYVHIAQRVFVWWRKERAPKPGRIGNLEKSCGGLENSCHDMEKSGKKLEKKIQSYEGGTGNCGKAKSPCLMRNLLCWRGQEGRLLGLVFRTV